MARQGNNITVPMVLPKPHALRDNPGYGPIRTTNIKVVGHSFVERLDVKLMEGRANTSLTIQDQLSLRELHIEPELLGQAGAYMEDMYDFSLYLHNTATEAVVLEIGSNDLCRSTPTAMLVERMRLICQYWLGNIDSLRYIVICQVLFRQRMDSRHSAKNAWQYNRDVITYNRQLRDWIDSTRYPVRFWSHKNMKFPEARLYEDGVHPSTAEGIWRYQKSIRSAIIMADRFLPL